MARKARRQKITSAEAISSVMAAAAKEINPPDHIEMGETDLKFFRSIINESANAEWTDHKIEVASLLAKTMADLEREQNLMTEEGAVLESARGGRVLNPRKAVVQMHVATIATLRRSLSIHGRGQGGELRDVAKRKAYAKAAQAVAQEVDDDLISMPSVH